MRLTILGVERSGNRVTIRFARARAGERSYKLDGDGAIDVPLNDLGLDQAELGPPGELKLEECSLNDDTGEIVMQFILPLLKPH